MEDKMDIKKFTILMAGTALGVTLGIILAKKLQSAVPVLA